MRNLLIGTGVAALLMSSGFVASSPAQASWAENAQGNPVFTGTNDSLRRSEQGRRNFSRSAGRSWDVSPGYGAFGQYQSPGYGAYGRYQSPGYGAYGQYNGYYR